MDSNTNEIKIDILKQVNEELQVNTKEIEHLKSQLESLIGTFELKIAEQMNVLNQEVKLFKSENQFLNKIPTKMGEKLNQIIPGIAKEVASQAFTEFNDKMRQAESKISELTRKVEGSCNKVSALEQSSFRKKLLTFGIAAICSSVISLGLCYLGTERFPQHLRIDHRGDLHIDHGKVLIWGHNEKTVKTKDIKK